MPNFRDLVMTIRCISQGGSGVFRHLHIHSCRLTCSTPCLDKYKIRSRLQNDFAQRLDSRNSASSSKSEGKMPDFRDLVMTFRCVSQDGSRVFRHLHTQSCRLTCKIPCLDKYKILSRLPNDFAQKLDSRNSASSSKSEGKMPDF